MGAGIFRDGGEGVMIRIDTLDGKLTHVARSYKIMEDGYGASLYLWYSPKGIGLYRGSEYDGREIPLSSLPDEIIKHTSREIFDKSEQAGRVHGEREWNALKEELEKEHHFCPFCDFPKDVQDAEWKIIPSIEELRKHIVQYHLRVSSDISIVDNKKVEYRNVKLSEGVTA